MTLILIYFRIKNIYFIKQIFNQCHTKLKTFPERVSQQNTIDTVLSNHQLIYCTRKSARIKAGTHKQITLRSQKNYIAEAYKEALSKVYFPNFENAGEVNKAYQNFIQKLMSVTDKLVPFKTKRVKDYSQEMFDAKL